MTVGVDDELRIREYGGDNSANPRSVPFKFLDNDDLRVTRTNADGSETALVRGVHFTVAGAGNPAGGSVTPLAPIEVGTSWRIEGAMSLGQPTDYTAGDDFPSESHERGLDRSMIAHQEARRDIEDTRGRSFMVPRGEVAGILPSAAARSGKYAAFNGEGEMLAVAAAPGGVTPVASNIVANNGETAQEYFDSLLDLSAIISVVEATELDADAVGKMVYVGGAGSFTLNLPPALNVGDGLKLVCARDYAGKLTVQAAAASGLDVDGRSALVMLAGESATMVYQGADGWLKLDAVERPVIAELLTDGVAINFVPDDEYVPIPMIAGDQLMNINLATLWLSGGYFTAPRTSVYDFDIHFWTTITGGPGYVDIAYYIAAATGGAPDVKNRDRLWFGGAANGKVAYTSRARVNEGDKIIPVIRVINPPITAGQVTTLASKMTVSEVVV